MSSQPLSSLPTILVLPDRYSQRAHLPHYQNNPTTTTESVTSLRLALCLPLSVLSLIRACPAYQIASPFSGVFENRRGAAHDGAASVSISVLHIPAYFAKDNRVLSQ